MSIGCLSIGSGCIADNTTQTALVGVHQLSAGLYLEGVVRAYVE